MLVHKSEKEIYISNNYKAKGNEKQKGALESEKHMKHLEFRDFNNKNSII